MSDEDGAEESIDFEALLETNTDDIKEPLPMPKGTYYFTISANKEFGRSSLKKTPYVQVSHVDPIPQDDVDPDDFAEALSTRKNGFTIKEKFYLSDSAKFMLKNYLKKVGVDTTGRTLRDCLEDIPGEQIGGHVIVSSTDKGIHYNEVTDWFPI